MSDSRERLFPANGAIGADGVGRYSGMAESLQQALRTLHAERGQGSGSVTPEMLQELARRAGLTDVNQVAEFSRMMGVGANQEVSGRPQHIVFPLGDVECAFPADSVQGVERITDITSVPNTVAWVLGVIHLRGAILSVVDLPAFFGLPSQSLTPRARVLVLTDGEMTIGMMVEGVTEMRSLDNPMPQATAVSVPAWVTPYATGAVNLEGRTVFLLDPRRLLYAEKMHRYRADFS